ncbi:hypothetical protein [Clostridium sp. LIBA-8841]|uniref:hypothetical protein n=1 Tax=Clostridium sp. LIBA-8841 TaxID=2987530 RepID=UPI002AC78B77|nr:hypothetical protein [Clostridium sp. LIBA-8841]MDZ5255272.1 hypothetical protein [Clostridium sp. LIBA-8841]
MNKETIDIEVEELLPFNDEADVEEFKKFLRQYGIEDALEDTTLEYTRKKLENLVVLAEEGEDPELAEHKHILKKLVNNLKGRKDKREAMKAFFEVYRDYEDLLSEQCGELLNTKELDKKIKDALREYKKYEHFKAHEEQIAQKWIRELNKEAIEYKKECKELKRDIRRDEKRLEK